ncbi:chaplin [Streptomyces sp. NPDC051567]|uniref:chaplin n=1 Tax=Streptomyces sp. NPDC051567 TaxID=3365660 RepID=UPI003797E9F2
MSRVLRSAALALAAAAAVVGGAPAASADAGAQGLAAYSPGVASGNLVQIPVHVPVNACGNTIGLIGLLNPSFGNVCVNS